MGDGVDFAMGFAGTLDVHTPIGTARGYTDLTLTAETVDWQAEEYFGRYHCHWLSSAVSGLTGWSVATFERHDPDGVWRAVHSGVLSPSGRVVDIFGERDVPAVQRYYSDSFGGAPVRCREMTAADVPGEVIHDSEDLRGDPHWWAREMPESGQAAYLHFARQVLTRTGHQPQSDVPPPRTVEPTHERMGEPAATFSDTVTVTGFGETCRRGLTKVELTPDRVTDEARELFGHRHCVALAVSLHRRTGWPLAVIDRQKGDQGEWGWDHVVVRHPSGDLVDIDGQRPESAVMASRAADGYPGAQEVRDLGGEDALRAALGVSPEITGPAWHLKRLGFPASYGPVVVDRVAAVVARDHVAPGRQSSAVSAGGDAATTSTNSHGTTTTEKGTAMAGIAEVRASLSSVTEMSQEAQGVLEQAGRMIGQIQEMLAQVASSQDEMQRAVGEFAEAFGDIERAQKWVRSGAEAVGVYAGRL